MNAADLDIPPRPASPADHPMYRVPIPLTQEGAAKVWKDRRRGRLSRVHMVLATAPRWPINPEPPRRPLLTRAQRALFAAAFLALLGLTLFAAVTRFGAAALRFSVG
jgi:hypothetical protein